MIEGVQNHNTIKVFIIDGNAIETFCIRDILEGDGSHLEVVEILPTTDGALALITSLKPNVILLRVSSAEEANSLEFIKLMKSQFPDLPLLVITSDNSIATILTALKNGASSYLLNSTVPTELKDALIKTSEHGSVLSPEVAKKMLSTLNTPTAIPITASLREIEILRLISKGLTNREIGQKLFVSTRTVDTHLDRMFSRFEVSTRTQAVLHGLKHQLFNLSDAASQ